VELSKGLDAWLERRESESVGCCVVYCGDGEGFFSGADGSRSSADGGEGRERSPLDRLLKRKRRHVITNGGTRERREEKGKTN
jgi:hypothetical protein